MESVESRLDSIYRYIAYFTYFYVFWLLCGLWRIRRKFTPETTPRIHVSPPTPSTPERLPSPILPTNSSFEILLPEKIEKKHCDFELESPVRRRRVEPSYRTETVDSSTPEFTEIFSREIQSTNGENFTDEDFFNIVPSAESLETQNSLPEFEEFSGVLSEQSSLDYSFLSDILGSSFDAGNDETNIGNPSTISQKTNAPDESDQSAEYSSFEIISDESSGNLITPLDSITDSLIQISVQSTSQECEDECDSEIVALSTEKSRDDNSVNDRAKQETTLLVKTLTTPMEVLKDLLQTSQQSDSDHSNTDYELVYQDKLNRISLGNSTWSNKTSPVPSRKTSPYPSTAPSPIPFEESLTDIDSLSTGTTVIPASPDRGYDSFSETSRAEGSQESLMSNVEKTQIKVTLATPTIAGSDLIVGNFPVRTDPDSSHL